MLDWFFRDAHGHRVLAQRPNAALWVFGVATVLRWSPYDARDSELNWIGSGALIVWGADELFRGATPFRRVLGALVLGWQIGRLLA